MADRVLDTDVLIDFLRGKPQAVEYIRELEFPVMISSISVGELCAGVREGAERVALESFLSAFDVVPVDEEIARTGGLFKRDFSRSHDLHLPDALIAATARVRGCPLVTLNRKHFPMLTNVHVPYQKS